MDFKGILVQLCKVPALNARFINTLSFLEYVGARKILKSQHESLVTYRLINHMLEELRHAQLLKRVALKMSDGKLETYSDDHLLCGQEARRYIQTVDFAPEIEVPWLNYLLTTLMLEERANLIYPDYEPLLAQAGFPGVLKAIVTEEDVHLRDVIRNLGRETSISAYQLNRLREIESEAFQRFADSIEAEITATAR